MHYYRYILYSFNSNLPNLIDHIIKQMHGDIYMETDLTYPSYVLVSKNNLDAKTLMELTQRFGAAFQAIPAVDLDRLYQYDTELGGWREGMVSGKTKSAILGFDDDK